MTQNYSQAGDEYGKPVSTADKNQKCSTWKINVLKKVSYFGDGPNSSCNTTLDRKKGCGSLWF